MVLKQVCNIVLAAALRCIYSCVFVLISALPSNWTNQSANQVVQLVRLAPSSPEYLEVLNHFVSRGGRQDQLYQVERIQNPQLYSVYMTFKKSMRGQINEMRLFHGTDAANVDSINAHNFSRSFAGVNGKCMHCLLSALLINSFPFGPLWPTFWRFNVLISNISAGSLFD